MTLIVTTQRGDQTIFSIKKYILKALSWDREEF